MTHLGRRGLVLRMSAVRSRFVPHKVKYDATSLDVSGWGDSKRPNTHVTFAADDPYAWSDRQEMSCSSSEV